jgi:Fic family protein
MMTLRKFSQGLNAIPTGTAWYLADLGRAMGKQELFTRQSPQRLKALREHALVESAVSSNRIEGVEVEPRRVATLVFGRPSLRDRNEEEVRGYRDALRLIHEQAKRVPVSEDTVCQLHRLARGEIADAGRYKQQDGEISRNSRTGVSACGFDPCPPPRPRQPCGTCLPSGTPSYVTNEFTP